MLHPVQVTPPASLPVRLEELRAHLNVDFPDDDTLLKSLNQAATDHLDGWSGILGRCLVSQEWRIDLCNFGALGKIRLPFPDVTEVEISYFDTENETQTVNETLYDLLEDAQGSLIRFKDAFTYPAVNSDRLDAVQVTFTAGFGDPADVPERIKLAIKEFVHFMYENRGGSGDMPASVNALISTYRRNPL